MNKFIETLKMILFKTFNGMFFRNKNKIVLDKNNNYNGLTIKFSNKFINSKTSNNIKIMSEKIKNFLIVMTRDCKNFKTDLLLNNFKKTLFDISSVDQENNEFYEGKVTSLVKNQSEVINTTYKINTFLSSNHELLHLSTLNLLISGFENASSDPPLGKGLDEGYTQLLAERYFNENKGEAYFFLVYFCKVLERIVGQDEMEKYYFNTSLPALIDDLKQYSDEENIINFVKDMDLLKKNDLQLDNPTLEEINQFQSAVDNISKFLLVCFKNKIDIILENDLEYDIEDYIDYLFTDIFVIEIPVKFVNSTNIKEYTVKLFQEEDIDILFDYVDNQIELRETKTKRR